MNTAMESRVTGSFGQYKVDDVHPSVMPRFFNHSTFGQKGDDDATSVKPTQDCACASVGMASQHQPVSAIAPATLCIVALLTRYRQTGWRSDSSTSRRTSNTSRFLARLHG